MDNDECADGMNNCQQLCVNTPGGFRCDCNPGFQLNADQATCSGDTNFEVKSCMDDMTSFLK